jgi:hypothetical protein
MNAQRRGLLALVPLALLASAGAAFGASAWDGTWSGLWGGTDEASITIVDNKVVSYSFKGTTQPVETESATDKQIKFGTKLFSITITRLADRTGQARFSSNTMGQTTADLTRQ